VHPGGERHKCIQHLELLVLANRARTNSGKFLKEPKLELTEAVKNVMAVEVRKGVCVCGWVWGGGGRELASYAGSRSESPIRASVSSIRSERRQ
jgi:hypothetical protein